MQFWKSLARTAILFVVCILAGFIAIQYYDCWIEQESRIDRLALLFSLVVISCPLSYFLLIGLARAFCYREVPAVPDAELPRCTVIVPAYNEGENILASLRSICADHYPADKLEIIAIDDGSIDDTLKWMTLAAAESGHRIRVIHFPENGGKRQALYRGFREGTGEVFVTIDSDSIVEPGTIASLVSPLVKDPRVGAVSGNVRVANLDGGLFPPMIDAGFTFAFEFVRAGQSVFQTIFCTPGALSAYRREALLPVADRWLKQTFMGHPAGIGEDRAMTNLILEQGLGVVFQRSALIRTNVPECYRGISRMLLRWERSNIRENFEMYRFIFRNFRWNDLRRWVMAATLLLYTLMTLLPVLLIWFTFYNIFRTNGEILLTIIAMALLWATLPAAVNLGRSTKLVCCSYLYGIVHALTLFWVVPYAFFTVGNSRWLTRSNANSAGKL